MAKKETLQGEVCCSATGFDNPVRLGKSTDVLTIAQLEAQFARREKNLEYLKASGAPEQAIRIAESNLKLTRRRLERARAADYDEEIQSLQQLGE